MGRRTGNLDFFSSVKVRISSYILSLLKGGGRGGGPGSRSGGGQGVRPR